MEEVPHAEAEVEVEVEIEVEEEVEVDAGTGASTAVSVVSSVCVVPAEDASVASREVSTREGVTTGMGGWGEDDDSGARAEAGAGVGAGTGVGVGAVGRSGDDDGFVRAEDNHEHLDTTT
jgi:hypothetical protein